MENKEDLEKELSETFSKVKQLLYDNKWDESHRDLWNKMVDLAYELHKIVKPKHHKYMIENRGVDPNDREFYNHIHPVEDLLAFINDPHANDDPEDQTIDHDFEIKIYSRRWGHYDTYNVKRTISGWIIGNIAISGSCDKTGKPYLFENLNHDLINYPEELPGYFEWLWEKASEEGLSHEKVQESLNILGEWISDCEKKSPKGIWSTFK
jgi:hypothetical protein